MPSFCATSPWLQPKRSRAPLSFKPMLALPRAALRFAGLSDVAAYSRRAGQIGCGARGTAYSASRGTDWRPRGDMSSFHIRMASSWVSE